MKRLMLVFLAGWLVSFGGLTLYEHHEQVVDQVKQFAGHDACPRAKQMGGDTFDGCEARLQTPDVCVKNAVTATVSVTEKLKEQIRSGQKTCRHVVWESGDNTRIVSDRKTPIPVQENGTSVMKALVMPDEDIPSGSTGQVTAHMQGPDGNACSCGSARDAFIIKGEVQSVNVASNSSPDTEEDQTADTPETTGDAETVLNPGGSATVQVQFNRETYCDVTLQLENQQRSRGISFAKKTLQTGDPDADDTSARTASTTITAHVPGTYHIRVEERCAADQAENGPDTVTGGCTPGDDVVTLTVKGDSSIADLDIVGMQATSGSGSVAGTVIPEGLENRKGGFVAINNVEGNQGNKTGQVASNRTVQAMKSSGGAQSTQKEQSNTDLLPIVLRKATTDGPDAQKYKLTYTSEALRVWKNRDRTGPVPRNGTSGAVFSAGKTTRLYVEGVDTVERARMQLKTQFFDEGAFRTLDEVRISAYRVSGPRRVAGGSTATYASDRSGNWEVRNGGQLAGNGSGEEAEITWNADGPEGTFTFLPEEAPDNHIPFVQDVQILRVSVELPRYLVDTGTVTDPASFMYREATVSVQGSGGQNGDPVLQEPVDLTLRVDNDNATLAPDPSPDKESKTITLTLPRSGSKTFYMRGLENSDSKRDTAVQMSLPEQEKTIASEETTVVHISKKEQQSIIFSLGNGGLAPGDPSPGPGVQYSDRVDWDLPGNVIWDNDVSFLDDPARETKELGHLIYPGKEEPGDQELRREVKGEVLVKPRLSGVPVYFKVLDVDDPSSDATVVDSDTEGGDNLGQVKIPTDTVLTGYQTNSIGRTSFDMKVSMYPGDNYRFAASLLRPSLNQEGVNEDDVPPNDRQATDLPSVSEKFVGLMSDLLTVWRRLHVDRDLADLVTRDHHTPDRERIELVRELAGGYDENDNNIIEEDEDFLTFKGESFQEGSRTLIRFQAKTDQEVEQDAYEGGQIKDPREEASNNFTDQDGDRVGCLSSDVAEFSTPIKVVSNTASEDGKFDVVVDITGALQRTDAKQETFLCLFHGMRSVNILDDGRGARRNPNAPEATPLSGLSSGLLYPVDSIQPFQPAFIEIELIDDEDDKPELGPNYPMSTFMEDVNAGRFDTFFDGTSTRGYWSQYVIGAYQPGSDRDGDPDRFQNASPGINAGPNSDKTPSGTRDPAEKPRFGSYHRDVMNHSILYLEPIRERSRDFRGKATNRVSENGALAHVIGHAEFARHVNADPQASRGLMAEWPNVTPEVKHFHPRVIKQFRNTVVWGKTGPANQPDCTVKLHVMDEENRVTVNGRVEAIIQLECKGGFAKSSCQINLSTPNQIHFLNDGKAINNVRLGCGESLRVQVRTTFSKMKNADRLSYSAKAESDCDCTSDEVKLNLDISLDVDIDSDNDDGFSEPERGEEEDEIEDELNRPGKRIAVNDNDDNANRIPDFRENGFEKEKFIPIVVELPKLPEDVDHTQAELDIRYDDQDPLSGGKSEHGNFGVGSDNGHLRLWTVDGDQNRNGSAADKGGDFIPSTNERKPYKPATLGFTKEKRKKIFFVEAIHGSQSLGDEKIVFEYDPKPDDGLEPSKDKVRATAVDIDIVATDVTGYRGIGDTPSSDVPRVPLDEEPDGIATDGSKGVEDGARLLLRIVVPNFLKESTVKELSAEWGYLKPTLPDVREALRFVFKNTLPSDPASEGKYMQPDTSAESSLSNMGIALSDETYELNNNKVVYSARIYEPPVEMNLEDDWSTKHRNLFSAVKLSSSKEEFFTSTRNIKLVRPPLVLVHGVNSDPGVWTSGETSFVSRFDEAGDNFGFIADNFRVNHSQADPKRPDEGKTLGFGEISHMYKEVRRSVEAAKSNFNNGEFSFGVDGEDQIAIQKVDIVAHSYGGLLTRWYTEEAQWETENGKKRTYDDRRDVRKIITLGTPHKGTPLANIVAAVYNSPENGIIRNADSGVDGFNFNMDTLLNVLDKEEFSESKFAQGALPNALTSDRKRPRHAYQIMSVNSQRLNQLNTPMFRKDIQYASIAGTQRSFSQSAYIIQSFSEFAPEYDNQLDQKKYWPWLLKFDEGLGVDIVGNDTLVPVWSARIGSKYQDVDQEHIQLVQDHDIQDQVRFWLNHELPDGREARAQTDSVPTSVRNAYRGSHIEEGKDTSIGAGLNRDAIVKLEVSESIPYKKEFSIPENVGIENVTLTGMIRKRNLIDAKFSVVSDEGVDNTLHNLDPDLNSYEISDTQMRRSSGSDFVAFSLPTGRIGRRQSQRLTGPDGDSKEAGSNNASFVGYEINGEISEDKITEVFGQSPPTKVEVPRFAVLPKPKKIESNGLSLRLRGAMEARPNGRNVQTQPLHLIDSDAPAGTDTLLKSSVSIELPEDVWKGVLLPYDVTRNLFVNEFGSIAGEDGSSGEKKAEVFQKMYGSEGTVKSTYKTVP